MHKYYQTINKHKCTLSVSLDSLKPDSYRSIRVGGNLNRVLENLRLIDSKSVRVYIDQTLMACNVSEYEDFVKFCQASHFIFTSKPMTLRPVNSMIISKGLIDGSLWFCRDKIRSWKEKFLEKTFNGVVASPLVQSVVPQISRTKCTAHYDDVIVFSNGECWLCHKECIGNLNKQSLIDIWSGKKASTFRKAVDDGSSIHCKRCPYITQCYNPSIDNVENYFDESILNMISKEDMSAIGFKSSLDDNKRKEIFIEAIKRRFAIFEFRNIDNKFFAFPCRLAESPFNFLDDSIISGKDMKEVYRKIFQLFSSPKTNLYIQMC